MFITLVFYLIATCIGIFFILRSELPLPLKANLTISLGISGIANAMLQGHIPQGTFAGSSIIGSSLFFLLIGGICFSLVFIFLWSWTHIIVFFLSITKIKKLPYASGVKAFWGLVLLNVIGTIVGFSFSERDALPDLNSPVEAQSNSEIGNE